MELKDYEREVGVRVKYDNDREQMDVTILLSKEQNTNIEEAVHILVSGIMLLVRSCDNQDLGVKSYELMQQIKEHMDNEYTSVNSFKNAKAITILKPNNK